ncbi:hypothetical protein Lnau_2314 [Legionella nautarum]|uniref:Uncharacterized protein n=1 Tax=Legionella nautarum TaxID=45070 RepID=A0A0W0WMK1_9GAMM|nr:hypothetical protein [Legionella nautarum]KTD33563.1 hypothetical protein Lnau_2314 [Legionella nautarum]
MGSTLKVITNDELQITEQLTLLGEASPAIYGDINFIAGHISSMNVHTHAVVVRNTGKLPTKNVRLGHNLLPVSGWPLLIWVIADSRNSLKSKLFKSVFLLFIVISKKVPKYIVFLAMTQFSGHYPGSS